MTPVQEENAIIAGLLRHETYQVMAARLGYARSTIGERIKRLLRRYGANDRWELEWKLKQK